MSNTVKPLARDPRVQPKVGDVIAKGTGSRILQRNVLGVEDDVISFCVPNSTLVHKTTMKKWWTWAADTKIRKVGT